MSLHNHYIVLYLFSPVVWLLYILLQAYQMHQELPVVSSLDIMSTHSSNWEVISDIVNVCSRTYRTPKQCKNRFDNVILPREEGKFLYDINPRKLKKSNKGLYKVGPLRR